MMQRLQGISLKISLTVLLCSIVFLNVSAYENHNLKQETENGNILQGKFISGKITDEKGDPLTGVTVVVKGSVIGVISDIGGNYKFEIPSSARVLIFSFIGMKTQEIEIGDRPTIDVVLQATTFGLNEVVAIGYGSARKKDITGSVATVGEASFNKGYITNAEQLIASKIPGVQVVPVSGKPGAGSTFLIRGGASLNASNSPLFVVDGVPLEAGWNGPGRLSFLNPEDIESFSILKDASSAAIYGSRGSNGVILITTKKSKSGKLKIDISSKFSIEQVANKEDVLTGDEFREFAKKAANFSGNTIGSFNLGTANTDWQDQIYQIAANSDNNISLSGGVKNLPYRLSFGYLTQKGVLKTSKYERFSSNLNLNPVFFDNYLKLNVSIKASVQKERIADERAISSAVTFDPSQPVYSGSNIYNGFFEYLSNSLVSNPALLHGHYNPLGMLEQVNKRKKYLSSVGNIQADYKLHFFPDLKFNLNTGYDVVHTESSYFIPASAYEQQIADGSVYKADPDSETKNLFLETYFNYVKNLSEIDSRIDALLGYSYHDFYTKSYFYPSFTETGVQRSGSEPVFPASFSQNTLISFYARFNYFLKDRYLLTATVRRDGSSRFSENNRWGTFPSLAFAWKIKQENFLKDVKVLSDLKLRLGYGITGQQDGIGNYDYIPTYTLGKNTNLYPIGNTFYQRILPSATDPNRKWEETLTYNLGLDWGFFDNRLSGNIDMYYKETSNLLNTITIPSGTGFTNAITKNIGNMENKGIEFSISGGIIKKKDMQWNANFNITYNENKITKLSVGNDDGIGLSGDSRLVNTVGQSRNTFYLYHQVYDLEGKPIEETVVDMNNDGIINEKDRYLAKSSIPKVFMGFSTDFTYKNWTASMSFRSNLGHYIFYKPLNNLDAIHNYVVPFNLNTIIKETKFKNAANQVQDYSDYYLQNASFLKMDNINIAYNFGKVYKNISLSLSASVQNVFTISKYKGTDPEARGNFGEDWGGNYPIPRVYAIGVKINL